LIRLKSTLFLLFGTLILACTAPAQEAKPDPGGKQQPAEVQVSGTSQEKKIPEPHRFWDKKNDWLFAGVGAGRTLDYLSTLNMRRRGRQELLITNDVVDNHPAFATIEAAGTGISIGTAYLFHRYGHHKLERWTSAAHFVVGTSGAIRNYCLKTAHSPTIP